MRRSTGYRAVTAGLVTLVAACNLQACKREKPQVTTPATQTTATSAPSRVELVLGESARQVGRPDQKLTLAWTAGEIAFVRSDTEASAVAGAGDAAEGLVYSIAHDYDQRCAVPIQNRSQAARRVVAEIGPLDGGLLGGFVGPGGDASLPLRIDGGSRQSLVLDLFAQDASRRSYQSHVLLRDPDSGALLAAAPLTVFVTAPKFALAVKVGQSDDGTLARRVTVRNEGETLTDFAAEAAGGLRGEVVFAPGVAHAHLGPGATIEFEVRPRLHTSFTQIKGEVVLRAGGQRHPVPLEFKPPAGKRVFIATGYSTTSDEAADWYCTNRPTVDTPIGGPPAPPGPEPCPQTPPDCFGLPAGNSRISQPGVPRLYVNDVAQNTVPVDYKVDHPNADVRIHEGIDYTSRVNGTPTKVPYKACVSGKVVAISVQPPTIDSWFRYGPWGSIWVKTTIPNPQKNYNTITVELNDGSGNKIQYLHSSEIDVTVGQEVTPDTIIGKTGDTGAPGKIHLHVQAKDKDWKAIMPDCALAHMPNEAMPKLVTKPPAPPTSVAAGAGGATGGGGVAGKQSGEAPGQPKAPPPTVGTPGAQAGGAAVPGPVPVPAPTPTPNPTASGGSWASAAAGPAPTKPNATVAAPRGRAVREPYARYRRRIYNDNRPESFWAFSDEASGESVGIQAWHSDAGNALGMRRIIVAVWDRKTQRRLGPPVALTEESPVQWPAAVALPGQRALVVWEVTPVAAPDEEIAAPPSLAYSVSSAGYAQWSPPRPVPGTEPARDNPGHFDPVPVLGPRGEVMVLWQQGEGAAARLRRAASAPAPDGASQPEPALTLMPAPVGLPAGASRPVPRVGPDGALHLLFQAPPPLDEQGVASAVYYARSTDGGANFGAVVRLSKPGVDAGEGDLLVAGWTLHAAFRTGPEVGSTVVYRRSEDGGESWGEPADVVPGRLYAEYPALFADAGGAVGVGFYGDDRSEGAKRHGGCATCAADGTSLKRFQVELSGGRWGEPRRLLTDFPAVQAAWLEVHFRLRHSRNDYLPHELAVLLNGHELIRQEHVVPEGNYLLRVEPWMLRANDAGIGENVVGVRTRHMNQGHYSTATGFRLLARHRFVEQAVVAGSQEEADALAAAEGKSVNHSRPDVGLFAVLPEPDGAGAAELSPTTTQPVLPENMRPPVEMVPATGEFATKPPPDRPTTQPASGPTTLPATPKQGETLRLTLRVANLGQKKASNVRVDWYEGDQSGGKAPQGQPLGEGLAVGDLAPLEAKDVQLSFPYGGAEHYSAVARFDGAEADFDPRNNVYVVSFTRAGQKATIQPTQLAGAADQDLNVWTGDDPEAPYLWRVVEAGTDKEAARVERGRMSGPLPPGKYQLVLQRYQWEGKEVRFPRVIEHQAGQRTRLSVRTAVEIITPPWLEQELYQWEVVRADKPDEVVQWQRGSHPVMLVPPGEYRVAVQPVQWKTARVLWTAPVKVEEDQQVVVRLDSGVAPPAELARETPPPHRWVLLAAGRPEPVQYVEGAWSPLQVPPGRYRWGLQTTQWKSKLVVFPEELIVREGELVRPAEPGRVEIKPSDWSGIPHAWRLVDAKTGEVVQEMTNKELSPAVVPPGEYDLYVQPLQWVTQPVPVITGLRVTADRTAPVALSSGLEVKAMSDDVAVVPPPHLIRYERQGDKAAIQEWTKAKWGAQVLPPGTYHVSLQPTQWTSELLRWPTPVVVRPGELARLTLDSGLRIAGPGGAKAEFSFQIREAGKQAVLQRGERTWGTQWLPPGKYDVDVRPGNNGPWRGLTQGVTVEAGRVTTVRMEKLPTKERPASGGAGVER